MFSGRYIYAPQKGKGGALDCMDPNLKRMRCPRDELVGRSRARHLARSDKPSLFKGLRNHWHRHARALSLADKVGSNDGHRLRRGRVHLYVRARIESSHRNHLSARIDHGTDCRRMKRRGPSVDDWHWVVRMIAGEPEYLLSCGDGISSNKRACERYGVGAYGVVGAWAWEGLPVPDRLD
jgi:hypothetical protein